MSIEKAHAICLPFATQSHIKALLKFAKLLHQRGFNITFVNTEFNHKRFLKTNTPTTYTTSKRVNLNSINNGDYNNYPFFQFETIPDGLPPSDSDSTQDIPSLCDSTRKNFVAPFIQPIKKVNDNAKANIGGNAPCVTCVVSDGFMSSSAESAAQEFGIHLVKFFSVAACGLMGFRQFRALLEKGLIPLKDENSLTNGFLDTIVDWVPGMKNIRLRDLPTFCRITEVTDIMFNFSMETSERASEASAVVIQTFDELERNVLDALSSTIQKLYAIGPLQLLLSRLPKDSLEPIQYSLWKEDSESLNWLNTQKPNTVLYVNFGSITVLTKRQVVEFGWGLANSNHPFLWVIRPDLVTGESGSVLPPEFKAEIKERSLIVSWVPQEDVLNHSSVKGFLTHCGWNSIMESLSSGVPMLCYPFFAEQQTNCRFTCDEWGIGLEIDNDVKRDQVEKLVRELMEGEKGKQMKSKAMEWKKLAQEATSSQGSSSRNLDDLVNQVLLPKT